MRKILCLLISLLMIVLCACGDNSSKITPVSSNEPEGSLEDSIANGIWEASYEETFKFKSLYGQFSPYASVGENLILHPEFDGETISRGQFALNQWVEQGDWENAYTVPLTGGRSGTPGMVYKQSIIGETESYAGYMLAVKKNTKYVLTAILHTFDGSNPIIRIVAESDKRVLAQTSGGYDDAYETIGLTFDTESETRVIIMFIGNAASDNGNICKNGKTILDDLYVYEASWDASDVLSDSYHIKDELNFEGWAGETLTVPNWGISDLYWYSNARAFYYDAVATIESDDSGQFVLRGRRKGELLGYTGVEFTWDTKLEKGYAYKFKVRMPYIGENPDIITVNDKIVWSRQYDDPLKMDGSQMLEFVYVCEKDEYARIRFICETSIQRGGARECSSRMVLSADGDWTINHLQCQRAEYSSVPEYQKYDLSEKTQFLTAGDKDAAKMLKTSVNSAAGEIKGLTELDYSGSTVDFYESSLNIMLESGFDIAKALELDTLTYNPSAKSCSNFDKWAKQSKKAGIKNLVVGLVLPADKKNCYTEADVASLITDANAFEKAISATAEVANKWLKSVPKGTVTVNLKNMEKVFGVSNGGIENSPVASISGYEAVKYGGIAAHNSVQNYVKQLKKSITQKLTNAKKVTFAYETSSVAFDITGFTKSESDAVLVNAVNRSSYNIALAAARGAGNTAGIPYGVTINTNDGGYRYGITNEAVLTSFLSLFHSGSSIIKNDLAVQTASGDAISQQGKAWYDAVRYAKTHPSVGKTVVRTAIIRGEGDEWSDISAKTSGSAYSLKFSSAEMLKAISDIKNFPTKWAAAAKAVRAGKEVKYSDTYIGDYSLLDVIFTKYGNAGATNTQYTSTGTPYGPADIISDTVSLDTLQNYRTLIYCGKGLNMTKETVDKLEQYVKNGGNLIIAVGQLKDNNGNLLVDEFAGISLEKQKTVDSLPYTYIEARGSRIIKRHTNGDPQALYKKTGKGSVSLFSGEYLSAYDNETVRDVISVILSQNTDVTFSESAESLEYTPSIKGDSIIIPFINHGRGYYPSGNGKDNGAWTGNVSVNVESFGLDAEEVEVYRVLQKLDGTTPVSLSKIKFSVDGESVVFNIDSAIIDEIVIGPKGQVEKDFYLKK